MLPIVKILSAVTLVLSIAACQRNTARHRGSEPSARDEAPKPICSLGGSREIRVFEGATFGFRVGDASGERDIKRAVMRLNGDSMTVKGLAPSGMNLMGAFDVIWDWADDRSHIKLGQENLIELELEDKAGNVTVAPIKIIIRISQ